MSNQDTNDHEEEKGRSALTGTHEDSGSNASFYGDNENETEQDAIQRQKTKEGPSDVCRNQPKDKRLRPSGEIRRTASNALSHVASRLTTRDWPEPPPPPDGGANAWLQVASTYTFQTFNTVDLHLSVQLNHPSNQHSKSSIHHPE